MMILLWKIRYLDRADKLFKDRHLYANTDLLDPTTRAAIEVITENKSPNSNRDILKFKHVFVECQLEDMTNVFSMADRFAHIGPDEYFEDETGNELTADQMGQILSGNTSARVIPHGAKQHDIDLMFAERKPIPLAEVVLLPEEVRLLGYFVRDLFELQNSALIKDGPGTLKSTNGPMLSDQSNPILETAVTDDEIRSFVTIFRRLYMTGPHDEASFLKIVPIFSKAMGDHPYGKWVEGTAKEYEDQLATAPESRPFALPGTCTFTTKRLIDVFLYTQFAHQPDKKRQRQFEECLAEVNDKHAVLTWMFLVQIWTLSLTIGNAGRVIARWFKQYCDCQNIEPNVLNSLRDHHAGIGSAEKEEQRSARVFNEKVMQLATDLWKKAGSPEGGASEFLDIAREQLTKALEK